MKYIGPYINIFIHKTKIIYYKNTIFFEPIVNLTLLKKLFYTIYKDFFKKLHKIYEN